jgi:DNA mismatch repair protein MutS
VARAGSILAELEKADRARPRLAGMDDLPLFRVAESAPPPPPAAGPDPVLEAILALNPDEMSPREAHEALYRLKALLKRK